MNAEAAEEELGLVRQVEGEKAVPKRDPGKISISAYLLILGRLAIKAPVSAGSKGAVSHLFFANVQACILERLERDSCIC